MTIDGRTWIPPLPIGLSGGTGQTRPHCEQGNCGGQLGRHSAKQRILQARHNSHPTGFGCPLPIVALTEGSGPQSASRVGFAPRSAAASRACMYDRPIDLVEMSLFVLSRRAQCAKPRDARELDNDVGKSSKTSYGSFINLNSQARPIR